MNLFLVWLLTFVGSVVLAEFVQLLAGSNDFVFWMHWRVIFIALVISLAWTIHIYEKNTKLAEALQKRNEDSPEILVETGTVDKSV